MQIITDDLRGWFQQLDAGRLPHSADKTLENPHVLGG